MMSSFVCHGLTKIVSALHCSRNCVALIYRFLALIAISPFRVIALKELTSLKCDCHTILQLSRKKKVRSKTNRVLKGVV